MTHITERKERLTDPIGDVRLTEYTAQSTKLTQLQSTVSKQMKKKNDQNSDGTWTPMDQKI